MISTSTENLLGAFRNVEERILDESCDESCETGLHPNGRIPHWLSDSRVTGGHMIGWMRRRLFPRDQVDRRPAAPPERPEPAHERDAEILEAIQRSSRAQAKLSARLDVLDSKIEGGFTDLRTAITAGATGDSARASVRWDDLLDAVDLLEEAIRALSSTEGREVGDGLRGIVSRLERFLAQSGLVRVGVPERLADGKLFRVVGTEDLPGLPDGVIARLVRSAVLDGDRVVREGEVIVNRRSS